MTYEIFNEFFTVSAETMGAQLASIRSREGTEYLWQGDPAFWERRAPVLFPYVGRLTDGIYTFEGKTYPLPRHGFAPTSEFTWEAVSDSEMWFHLDSSPDTLAIYPFHFRFSVGFRLSGRTLIQTYRVENRDGRTMYFGLGSHPGFHVPLEEGLAFEDYQISICPDAQPILLGLSPTAFMSGDDRPFPLDGGILPLRHDCFDNDSIALANSGSWVCLSSPKGKRSVTIEYPDCPYLIIWHKPHVQAPYVCLEPWHSLPARDGVVEDLQTQPSLLSLPAHETYCTQLTFRFT